MAAPTVAAALEDALLLRARPLLQLVESVAARIGHAAANVQLPRRGIDLRHAVVGDDEVVLLRRQVRRQLAKIQSGDALVGGVDGDEVVGHVREGDYLILGLPPLSGKAQRGQFGDGQSEACKASVVKHGAARNHEVPPSGRNDSWKAAKAGSGLPALPRVRLEDVSPHLVNAVLVTEDKRF